ncbi:MAG: glycosyl hydrolase family 28 protein [Verrucomicrobiia bacterium]
MIHAPSFHPAFPRSDEFHLEINGQHVDVLRSDVASFAICAVVDEPAHVVVRSPGERVTRAGIHPMRLGVEVSVAEDGTVTFVLDRPQPVLLRPFGLPDLYLLLHDKADVPPSDSSILRIPSGQIVERPTVDLDGYAGLHIEAGAVLRSRLFVRNKRDVRVTGQGIFDGSFDLHTPDHSIPAIVTEGCPGALIEDITVINPRGWMIVVAASDGTIVRNTRQLGKVISSDGIDVLGSSGVVIEDCFISNNDDCVAIKAFELGRNGLHTIRVDGRQNVHDVLVRRCVLANGPAGNAMEIGHELTVDRVRDICFEDIDVLSVHGHGAVFSIHNGDRATVENITYENIRIEHCYDKLIDFRVMRSRFNTDTERGHIRNVALRDIHWTSTPYNPGYTVSIIGGWDADHPIENVTLKNVRIDGKPVTSLDDLDLFTRHARDIKVMA